MAPDPPEDTRSTPLSPETPEPSLQVSMSAARAEDPEALSSRVEGARQQLAEVIDEMHAVLAWDLPVYPEREGKKRFLDAPEKAAEMAEGELAAIKKELRGVGSGIAAQVVEALRSHGPWQSEEASAEEGGARSLDGNPEVTAALYRVARATQAVLARCGLASAEESLRYKTPTWFIEGRYMPGLIEKYWRWLGEVREGEQARVQAAREDERRSLARRWEDA